MLIWKGCIKYMKRFFLKARLSRLLLIGGIVVCMIGLWSVVAQALEADDKVNIVLDEKAVDFDVQPQIKEGRTLVPLRGIFESLGATVNWDNTSRTITITNADKIILMQPKKTEVEVNGQHKILDVAPYINNGRTMVPLRFISENLDANVEWINTTRTVKINSLPIEDIYNENKAPVTVNEESSQNQQVTEVPNVPTEVSDSDEQSATIDLVTSSQTLKVGDTVDITLYIEDVNELYAFESLITFDTDSLKATKIKGEFLGGIELIKKIDNTAGTVYHVATKLGKVAGKSGEGALTVVSFEALKEGTAKIQMGGEAVQMVNSSGEFIKFTSMNDSVIITISQ